MEGVNSFEKGLHRSNSPAEQPEGSYTDALNWIRNDSGRLINEDLENIVHTFSKETILLGQCPIKNEFICFLKTYNTVDEIWNSVIGTFSEGVYTEIFNDKNHTYKLNFTNSIDSVARIVSSGSRVTYFVEDGNPIRRFDLDSYLFNTGLYDTYEDFNLQLTVKYPKLSTTISTGGTLAATVYSFVSRYIDSSNNKTPWNIPSRVISIVPGDSLQEDDQGAPPDDTTDKKITVNINDSDLNYPFIEIGVIKYEGITNVKVSKSLGVFRNDSVLNIDFTSNSDLKETIDISSIVDVPIYYNSAKCIEQKDNILLISNLTLKKYDQNFQQVANSIVVTTYIDKKPIDINRGVKVRGWDISTDTWNPISGGNLIGFGSADYTGSVNQFYGADGSTNEVLDEWTNNTNWFKDSSTKKGFQPDEVYSFSITPIYNDGSIGFAYHIPCNRTDFYPYPTYADIYRTTKKYESSLEYPEDMNMGTGVPIRHHIMPSVDPVSNEGNQFYMNILRVKFFNINIPDALKSQIQGYIIGYQQRNKDSNTRIIDEGIAIPYNYYTNDSKYYNGVLNGRGIFYASDTLSGRSYVAMGPDNPYAMFYSPSSELGLEIKQGYKFSIWKNANHYYYNPTATASNKYYEYTSILRHTNPDDVSTYDAQFFDGNKISQGEGYTSTITNSLKNNTYYDHQKLNVIDGKFIMGGGHNYIHIETEGQIWRNTPYNNIYNIVPERITTEDDPFSRKRIVEIEYFKQQLAMARVTNEIPNQYGNVYNAEYLVAETILDPTQTEVEVEGDTYTFKHWYNIRSIHKQNVNGTDRYFNFDYVAGIWLRSQNNFALRHRADGEAPYYPETKVFFEANTSASTSMFGVYWWLRSLGYNKQYSVLNNFKLNFPKPLLFSENNVFANRTIYSVQSFESELTDQYRVFPAFQYHDIPKDRGAITDTFVFNNNLFHHTEYGLWLSYFNPNTIQSTTQGDVVLGNAGIFRIPSKIVLDIKGGYMGTLDKSGINTPFGRIFIDHSQKKIFLFDGASPVEISDLGLFSHFRNYISSENAGKYFFGYDWENKRILLSLSSITNNAVRPTFTNPFNNTFETARDLEELDSPIKTRYGNTSTIFKLYVSYEKLIKISVAVAAEASLKIFKLIDGQREEIQNITIPGSFAAETFYIQNINFDIGQYYIQILTSSTTLRLIDFMSYPYDKLSISYYPKTQTWTSFHDFTPNSYLTLNGSSYAYNEENSSFYNLKNINGIKKNSYITFVTNSSPDAFKRFDRIEMNTMSGGKDGKYFPGSVLKDNYDFIDKSFSHIHCWTDRQNSTQLPFLYSHNYDIMSEYYNDKIPANYYRSSFHAELPMDAVINPYINIFHGENLDINAEFKSHLKSKFLYTKLSYKDTSPLVLNYVKTFFKPTVA